MKNQYRRTNKSFSEGDCALSILFQLYSFKAGLFEGNLFWVG